MSYCVSNIPFLERLCDRCGEPTLIEGKITTPTTLIARYECRDKNCGWKTKKQRFSISGIPAEIVQNDLVIAGHADPARFH